MNETEHAILANYADHSFRDMADQDYITSRFLYKVSFFIPAIWSALQCVEKYLKAILLYNKKSAKNISHDINEAYNRVTSISDINFDFPEDVKDFIHYLNEEGMNRYFDFPYVFKYGFLWQLDKTVWFIRRYCYHYRIKTNAKNGVAHDILHDEIKMIQSEVIKKSPHKFKIHNGLLEKILEQPNSEARKILVWKNPYYGKNKRKKIRDFRMSISSGMPTHYIFPKYLRLITAYSTIPNKVCEFIKKKHNV